MKSINILVTGGAGFIGSHFAKTAKLAGHNPVVIDNLSNGHQHNVKYGPFVHADLRDTYQVEKALRDHNIAAVVNFAGKIQVGESVYKPDYYYSNNVTSTLSLISAMKSCGVKKIVFSSSAAVYGMASDGLLTEDSSLTPINPYGWSKQMSEQIIQDCAHAFSMNYALLRYFNVIGEDSEGELCEEHEPETHLVPNVVKAILAGESVSVFGDDYQTEDGTAVRDYVDIKDLAKAHLSALEYIESGKNLISNIGRGRGYSVKEIVDAVSQVFGKKPKVEIKPRRKGDPPRLVADNGFFKTWYPEKLIELEESLKTMKINREKRKS